MPIVSVRNLTIGFGGHPLLDDVDFQADAGERICLVGRNGEGKSCFLRIIAGDLEPEAGKVVFESGLRVARLPQEVPTDLSGTAYDLVADGLGDLGHKLAQYHDVGVALAERSDEKLLARFDRLQKELDALDAWALEPRVERVLTRLGLEPDRPVNDLSAGVKRRVLLARALVQEPDLLLLDEPTNHLDIDSISWLEEFLIRSSATVIFVTHDRALVRHVATRIVEVDRGRLHGYSGGYDRYLEERETRLEQESKAAAAFDKKLAEEEAWIRRGIKARRTRNEGRVRRLEELRDERRDRRELSGTMRAKVHAGEASGRLVIEAKNVTFGYDAPIIRDFSTQIFRGDRIGLIGPNGVGKTTLLELLLGHLEPQSGTITHGTRLEIAYFDQLQSLLDENKSLLDNISDGQETITVGGQQKHIYGYVQDFLFTPERARCAIHELSGGERKRLLLAKLFTRPANLLVLDEPTNDLDVPTLELLEEMLLDFPGTVLVVSHDREFLDRVVTANLVFEGDGVVREFIGNYDDWRRTRDAEDGTRKETATSASTGKVKDQDPGSKKLSYKETQELGELPAKIEALEAQLGELHDAMADPTLYQQGGDKIAELKARTTSIETELPKLYARWEELEARA